MIASANVSTRGDRFTGLRRGDVIGLQWESVDRSRGMLIVHREKDDKPLSVPLNGKSDAVLARRSGAEPGGVTGYATKYVFRSQSWDTYRTAWEAAVRRAKLHGVTFHSLRHTCASWLAQAGRSMKEIQDFLGHRSVTMTNRYAHLAPSHLRAAAAVLDTAFDVPAAAPADAPPSSESTTGAHQPKESPAVS